MNFKNFHFTLFVIIISVSISFSFLHAGESDIEKANEALKGSIRSSGFDIICDGSSTIGYYAGEISCGTIHISAGSTYFVAVFVEYYDAIPKILMRYPSGSVIELSAESFIEDGIGIAMFSLKEDESYTAEFLGSIDSNVAHKAYMIIGKN